MRDLYGPGSGFHISGIPCLQKKISLRYKIGDKFVRKNKESTKEDLPYSNRLNSND